MACENLDSHIYKLIEQQYMNHSEVIMYIHECIYCGLRTTALINYEEVKNCDRL